MTEIRQAIWLTVLASINLLLLFLLQYLVLVYIGPGEETDALFAGMVIPQLVMTVAVGSLAHVLTPLLSGETDESFRLQVWTLIHSVGLIFSLAALLLGLLAPYWVPLLFYGFEKATSTLTVSLVQIQLVGMVAAGVNGVLTGGHNARRRFIKVEFAIFTAGVLTVAGMLWGLPRYGILAAAVAFTGRMLLQNVFLLWGLGKYRRPDFNSPTLALAWKRMKPLLIGSAYYKTERLLDRALASMALPGSLSLLHLADQIYRAGNGVLTKALAAPLVPKMAVASKAGRTSDVKRMSRRRLSYMLVIGLIIVGVIAVLGRPVIGLLFSVGEFSDADINRLWLLLLALSGMFVGSLYGQVVADTFYAQGDTLTPTRVGMACYTVGIPLKIIGMYFGGVLGLAVATSIYHVSTQIVQLWFLNRSLNRMDA